MIIVTFIKAGFRSGRKINSDGSSTGPDSLAVSEFEFD